MLVFPVANFMSWKSDNTNLWQGQGVAASISQQVHQSKQPAPKPPKVRAPKATQPKPQPVAMTLPILPQATLPDLDAKATRRGMDMGGNGQRVKGGSMYVVHLRLSLWFSLV